MDKERKQGYQPICKGNQDGVIPPNIGSRVKMDSFDLRPYMNRLKEAQTNPEHTHESAHIEADDVLCDLLKALGYEKVVEEYDKISKFYS